MEFDFTKSYFECFQLEAFFSIDQLKLADQYQLLQLQFHPDRFVNANDQDKRIAMQVTSHINEAFKTLKDDQMRARYLLQMQGVEFDEDKDTTQDMEFLVGQMELREAIDTVDQQSDALTALDTLAEQAAAQKKQLVQVFQESYDQQQWEQAKEAVLKLQFFKRLLNQIAHKQEALEDELI